MDKQVLKKLVVKTTLEVLQNVLPTNIMESLERLDEVDDSNEASDDLEEDRFFYEYSIAQSDIPKTSKIIPRDEPAESDSLTYFEIVEQEMMLSLPVTKYNIEVC